MLLIFGLVLLVGTALLLSAVFPVRGWLANLLAVACLMYGQVVVLSELLSELALISPARFIGGHALLFGGALALWLWRGRPDLFPQRRLPTAALARAVRSHRLLTLFAAAVALISLTNLGLSLRYPTSEHDEMNYHLPRAYFWAENGTARHYYTPDERQTEFPPNASFAFLWVYLLAGGPVGMAAPQWLAGIVAAGGTAALAHAAGFRRDQALFAGLFFLTTTNGIQQMASGHNDLLVAAPAVCFGYFALRAIQNPDSPSGQHALVYSGLAFGLMLGTKYTAFFLLPGIGLALAGYAVFRLRRRALRVLLLLGLSAAVGFALFGAYNYVLNLLDFGNPIASDGFEAASSMDEEGSRGELTGLGNNLVRYLYQLMDWSILPDPQNTLLFQANAAAYKAASQLLNIDPQAPQEFDFVTTGLREPYFSASGYGAVVYLVVLASPLVWVSLLVRRRWLPALLVVVAWAWLLVFALLSPWSPWKPRYFHIFMPLLLAGILPLLYIRRRSAWLWLLPLMLAAVLTAGWATTVSFGRREAVRRTLDGVYAPLVEAGIEADDLNLLRAALPEGAAIGLAGFGTWPFKYIRHIPDFRYVSVPPQDIQAALEQGTVQAVLASRSTCRRTPFAYFPMSLTEHVGCLFVADPQVVVDHLTALKHDLIQTAFDRVAALPATAVYRDGRVLTVSLPTGLLESADLRVDVLYAGSRPAIARAGCNGQPTAFEVLRSEVQIDFPAGLFDAARSVQSCVLELADEAVFEIEEVRAVPGYVPPPNADANLRFGDDLLLLAFDLDENQPVERCERLYVGSWWRALQTPDADYEVTMVLADSSGVGQARQNGPLAGYRTSQLDAGQGVLDRRFVPIPCTPSARQYDLLVGLVNRASGEAPTIYLSDGAPLGSLAYLTTVTLAGGS